MAIESYRLPHFTLDAFGSIIPEGRVPTVVLLVESLLPAPGRGKLEMRVILTVEQCQELRALLWKEEKRAERVADNPPSHLIEPEPLDEW